MSDKKFCKWCGVELTNNVYGKSLLCKKCYYLKYIKHRTDLRRQYLEKLKQNPDKYQKWLRQMREWYYKNRHWYNKIRRLKYRQNRLTNTDNRFKLILTKFFKGGKDESSDRKDF